MRGDDPLNVIGAGFFGVGADMIYSQLSKEEKDWNKMVSEFVADLVINSKNFDDVRQFLEEKRSEGIAEEMAGRWLIRLPGSGGR